MYEKHVQQLQAAKHTHGVLINEALDAAIALMRAAEPKDEKAEREHCEHAVADAKRDHGLRSHRSYEVGLLLRERAAARAEVIVQARVEAGVWSKDAQDWKERAIKAESELARLRLRDLEK